MRALSDERRQRAAWALLVLTSTVYFLAGNEADPDLWVHLLTGRRILESGQVPRVDDLSYTAAGASWVDHEWLAQCLMAATYLHVGDTALWLLKLAVGCATAFLLWRPIAAGSGRFWVRGVVMLLGVAIVSRGFAIRPQIFTYLAVAALLRWLEGREPDSPRADAAALAVVAAGFAVWANLHGGFVAGLGILAVYATVTPALFDRRRWRLLLAAVLGVCANPYGARLLGYLAQELTVPHPSTEWQPLALGDPAQVTFILFVAALLATLPFAQALRRVPWRAALCALFVVMAFSHQRHTPLLALTAAGPLAEQLDGAWSWAERRTSFRLSALAQAVLTLAVLALCAFQGTLLGMRLFADRFHVVFDGAEYPVAAVRYLRGQSFRGNLAVPLDWGSYVLWHLAPNVKVSLDGRFATVYPPSVVESNFNFFVGASDRLVKDFPTNAVLAPARAQPTVSRQAGWSVRYRDEVAQLVVQGAPSDTVAGRAVAGRLPFP